MFENVSGLFSGSPYGINSKGNTPLTTQALHHTAEARTSIALSGKFLSGMYCAERRTAASSKLCPEDE
eukprot:6245249-Amphidinium_carterae.1